MNEFEKFANLVKLNPYQKDFETNTDLLPRLCFKISNKTHLYIKLNDINHLSKSDFFEKNKYTLKVYTLTDNSCHKPNGDHLYETKLKSIDGKQPFVIDYFGPDQFVFKLPEGVKNLLFEVILTKNYLNYHIN